MSSSKSSGTRRTRVPKTPVERFIHLLTEALVVNRVSQRELAERLGITIGTLTKYLRGEVFPLNVKAYIHQKLAKLVGVSTDSLFDYYETGQFTEGKSSVNLEQVGAWLRNFAGTDEISAVLEHLSAAHRRVNSGSSESNESQSETESWTDERAAEYSRVLRESFQEIAEEKALGELEAWGELCATSSQREKPSGYVQMCQGVLANKLVLTAEMAEAIITEYGTCPARDALEEWSGRRLEGIRAAGCGICT